jgi:hypothetical protein
MQITLDKEDLTEVNIFVHKKMVPVMNEYGLGFNAMAFILQTLMNAIDNVQDKLDKEENK